MGLHPGPDMLTKHLAVTYSMVWTLVLANVITVIACLALLPYLAYVTRIRGSVIIPFLLLLVFVGSYTANKQIADLLVTLAAGALGYLMVRFDWPRAPLVLGFVLGKLAETYLFISMARYGYSWLAQPLVIALIVLTVVVIVFPYFQERRSRAA
jgi:TctA family transporter